MLQDTFNTEKALGTVKLREGSLPALPAAPALPRVMQLVITINNQSVVTTGQGRYAPLRVDNMYPCFARVNAGQ